MSFKYLKEFFLDTHRNIFLVDGFGALVSAFLLGIVLVKFENYFGIPVPKLYFLAILSCLFALYDLYCFTRIKKNIIFGLEIISYLNIWYCFITIGLAAFYYKEITYLGWTYFFVEILIIAWLASLEYKTANFLKRVKTG